MTTMDLNGTTYTVLYVDPGASGANNGSSTTDALTALPATASLAATTAYIVRRTATENAWTVGTCSNNNVIVMGCPKTTDMLKDIVPSAVMSAWGADSPDRAIFLSSSATAGIIFSGTNNMLSRLEIRSPTSAGSNSTGVVQMSGATPGGLRDCIIKVKSFDITDGSRTALVRLGLLIGGIGVYLMNCEIHGSAQIPVDFRSGSTPLIGARIVGSTFKWWDTAAQFAIGGTSTNVTYNLVVDGCYFYKRAASGTTYDFIHRGDNAIYRNCTWDNSNTDCTTTGTAFGTAYVTFINCTWNFHVVLNATIACVDSARGTFINCSFTTVMAAGTKSSGTVRGLGTAVTPAYLKDCSFSIDGYTTSCFDTANNVLNHFENVTVTKGGLGTDRKMKIAALDVTGFPTAAGNYFLTLRSQAQLYIVSLTNPSGSNVTITQGSTLFIDSCTNAPTLDFGAAETSSYYCLNEGGVTGNWHAETLHNKITASSTYRTGSGVSYCYKFEGKTVSTTTCPAIWLAPRPYQGVPVTFGSTGRKSITVYIAYKNYTPTLDDFSIEVEVPDGVTPATATKTITSKDHGYIIADSSTWNGDSGLTTKAVTIIIDNLDRAENVYVRIGYNKYASSAYMLVDPTFVGASA